MTTKRTKIAHTLWALYVMGESSVCGIYESEDDARDDAYGPVFERKGYVIVEYVRGGTEKRGVPARGRK